MIIMYYYDYYICYCNYAHYCLFCFMGWLESVGSRVVYELDYKKPILYVIPIQSILGKLPVVPNDNFLLVTPALSRTTCATHFLALPATPTGCWRWMQDVVRQVVGFGMVAGHVMNLKGSQRAPTHGERFHVTSMQRHVWAMLSSALHVLYRFRSFLPAVHCGYKLWAEYAAP